MSGICENCGGIIKGTGTRWCSYCRKSREVKNIPSKFEKNKTILWDRDTAYIIFMGIFFLLWAVLMYYLSFKYHLIFAVVIAIM